jgi:septum formation inhibitor MinC
LGSQVREAQVAAKLRQEVIVLDQRLAEIDSCVAALKKKIRRTPDAIGKKMAFMQMRNLQKQAVRFTRLYQICSSMEDDVREQAIMKNTSTVLQEFVTHHEDLIKDSSMEKLVREYEGLRDRVGDITSNVGILGNVLMETTDYENGDTDWDEELRMFLEEDESLDDRPTISKDVPLPPESQAMTSPAPSYMPDVPSAHGRDAPAKNFAALFDGGVGDEAESESAPRRLELAGA